MISLNRSLKLISCLMVLALLFQCTTHDPQSGVQDFPNTLQAGVREGLFDLPTSAQSPQPSVNTSIQQAALIKSQALLTDDDEIGAFAVYMIVPIYINLVEGAKNDLVQLIRDLAQNDLPPHWEGMVEDSLYVSTDLIDTTVEDLQGRRLTLRASRNGELRILLDLVHVPDLGYAGRFLLMDPAQHDMRVLIDFSAMSGRDQEMAVTVTRDTLALEKPSDPTRLRVKATKKANGNIHFSGASYHPLFTDQFWSSTPKIYAFKGVSDPVQDKTLLKVAFGDALDADSNFFDSNAMDKAVLRQSTATLRQTLIDSTNWWKAVSYCLENDVSLDDAYANHAIELVTHTPSKPASEFNSDDLTEYLELNRDAILGRRAGFADTRGMYFLIRVHQPLYLQRNATLVGYGQDRVPVDFPLSVSSLDSLNPDRTGPVELPVLEITP